jgi:hypothetical protein
MSQNGLLVLASERNRPTRATRKFRKDVLAEGGVWNSHSTSIKEMLDAVKTSAPGSHVLVLGDTDEPASGLYSLVASAIHLRPLVDIQYGNFLRGTSPAVRKPEVLRRPAWSPHRLRHENYVGASFLVRTSYLVLTLELLLVDSNRIDWNPWDFLAIGVAHGATVEGVDEAWTTTGKMSGDGPFAPNGARTIDFLSTPGELTGLAPKPEECELITLTAGAADLSRGHSSLIEECLEAMSTTDAAQVIHTIGVGEECSVGVGARLTEASRPHVTMVPALGEFNFAARCNEIAIRSEAEILVFINDDFIPTSPTWLSQLLDPFADPSVAITGGTLLYADETIQHIGMGIVRGNFQHIFVGESLRHPRVAQLTAMNREVDAVTGACFAIRSDVFHHVGGFFEGFPLNYNDVDLCLKARAAGYSVIHVGAPIGYHLESKTRHAVMLAEETTLFESRWPIGARGEYPFEHSF